MTTRVLGTFYGDEEFPIQWEEGEQQLFWIYDDLHIPNPVSPMFFDIGGWWLTCDHMFRRFGTPFACDWIAKIFMAMCTLPPFLLIPHCMQRRRSTKAAMSPVFRAIHRIQNVLVPTWVRCCRTMPKTSWIGGESGSGPKWSTTSPTWIITIRNGQAS